MLGLVVLSGAICVRIELFICCLQAFIFTILISVYRDDHCFFLGR